MRRSAPTWMGVALLLVAACGGDKSSFDADPGKGPGSVAHRDSALRLGPGDVQIVNEDSSVDLALVGQQIIVRLSDKTMATVRRETDTNAVKDSGFGGSI
ncbi:MAG TPA: hypothetical protein VJO33_08570, partial [Gemmatimonadaceae bacterium]|nr:hypothetical protein [Gemmatimonadaceae bacterium]